MKDRGWNFRGGGERAGVREGMEEKVNGKVGDISGIGGRAEVEEVKVKVRALEKGLGERVLRGEKR